MLIQYCRHNLTLMPSFQNVYTWEKAYPVGNPLFLKIKNIYWDPKCPPTWNYKLSPSNTFIENGITVTYPSVQ